MPPKRNVQFPRARSQSRGRGQMPGSYPGPTIINQIPAPPRGRSTSRARSMPRPQAPPPVYLLGPGGYAPAGARQKRQNNARKGNGNGNNGNKAKPKGRTVIYRNEAVKSNVVITYPSKEETALEAALSAVLANYQFCPTTGSNSAVLSALGGVTGKPKVEPVNREDVAADALVNAAVAIQEKAAAGPSGVRHNTNADGSRLGDPPAKPPRTLVFENGRLRKAAPDAAAAGAQDDAS